MKTNFDNLVALPVQSGYIMVLISDIVHCKAAGNQTHVYLVNGKEVVLYKRLNQMEKALPKKMFYRVHNSHLVNFKHVEMWVERGKDYLFLSDGTKTPVARVKRKDVRAWLGVS
jgi:two-component system, LytTR family, response regulator